MDNITRSDAIKIEEDIKLALSLIAQRHGITIDVGGIRYNSSEFKISVSGAVQAKEKVVEVTHNDLVKSDGMLPGGLYPVGTMFRRKRTIYEITKVDSSKPKNVYTIKSHNGAGWICDRNFMAGPDIAILRVGPAVK